MALSTISNEALLDSLADMYKRFCIPEELRTKYYQCTCREWILLNVKTPEIDAIMFDVQYM